MAKRFKARGLFDRITPIALAPWIAVVVGLTISGAGWLVANVLYDRPSIVHAGMREALGAETYYDEVVFWAGVLLTIVIAFYFRVSGARQLKIAELATAMDEAQSIAHLGSWQLDFLGGHLTWSRECFHLFGLDPKAFVPTFNGYLERIHPDDKAKFLAAREQALKGRTPGKLEVRIMSTGGEVRHVLQEWENVFDESGRPLRASGTILDITDRKRAEAALRQRDRLFGAVAESAAALVTSPNIDDAIQASLRAISGILKIDRMLVLEAQHDQDNHMSMRYVWQADGVKCKADAALFQDLPVNTADMMSWLAPLRQGRIVVTDARTANEEVREICHKLGFAKNLIVPIMVDGKYWGQIGIDSSDQDRMWADFEVELMQTLAELIGNAIRRERYTREIADANRIVQNSPTILFRLRGEPGFPLVYISQNVKVLGYEPAALIAAPQLYQSLMHKDDADKVRELLTSLLEKPQSGAAEFRLITAQGACRWMESRFSAVRDSGGRLVEIEGLLIDITDRKQAEEKIALLARTDPLTGLANRSTFIEHLRQAFAAARRGTPPFAVLYADLDRFKDINDTLGHPVGDRLLVVASERFKQALRESDVVARLGGDEFAIILGDVGTPADAGSLAGKLRVALAEPFQVAGNTLHITASIGIAIYAPGTTAPEDLLAQADVALYRAKEEGRDQYRFHTDDLDRAVRGQVEMAGEIRQAIQDGEFELYFQPQVEFDSNNIVGMEALVRWHHPRRGLLLPSDFIDVAERTGLMTILGQWILERACQQMSEWRAAGIAPPSIAVNVSLLQLKSAGDFVDLVANTLRKWGLNPSNLELDVTESMLARTTLSQNDVLERLQKLGVRISIDDFGTKYSSLDYLRMYRVSRLKIPPALTRAAAHNAESAALVRAIVGIARELRIDVVAQGIETPDQWTFLSSTPSAPTVQGFYYSEPVPKDGAGRLLREGIAPSKFDIQVSARERSLVH